MTTENTYNGYTNYETWAVALWLTNEEGTYRYWREVAKEERREAVESWQVKESVWPAKDAPRFRLAQRMREEVAEGAPEIGPSLYSDLLNAALSEVNWDEVADGFLEE